ncbi:MAG: toll/interleukin-1 receptor domain-containing protein [Planctomycetes bacterium]|nr:toll/interleukin-1 receptor domain-containing protein [Planctomycetota bacterium]
MKVFISWSGETSKALAERMRTWLTSVIQTIKPYFSPDDIAKGARWSGEIAKELEESRIGIICLTRDNLGAPWVLFEAGALSKSLTRSRVCPILFGVEPTDVKGPLSQFQLTRFHCDDVRKMLETMNRELGDGALAPKVLDAAFATWWPQLDRDVREILSRIVRPSRTQLRTDRELLEEILGLARAIAQKDPWAATGLVTPDLTPEFVQLTRLLAKAMEVASKTNSSDVLAILHQMDTAMAGLMEKLATHYYPDEFLKKASPYNVAP